MFKQELKDVKYAVEINNPKYVLWHLVLTVQDSQSQAHMEQHISFMLEMVKIENQNQLSQGHYSTQKEAIANTILDVTHHYVNTSEMTFSYAVQTVGVSNYVLVVMSLRLICKESSQVGSELNIYLQYYYMYILYL